MIATLRLFCLAAFLALCTWGLYLFTIARETGQKAALLLEDPVSVLGECPLGPLEVRLVVKNVSEQPHAILSVLEGCWPNCCIRVKDPLPVTVLPGSHATLHCEFHVKEPGPFKLDSVIYVDDNGLRSLDFHLHGVGTGRR